MAPTAKAAVVRSRARAAAIGRLMTVSTSVFHASHDGHCPDQRGVSAPHCWQTWTVRVAGTNRARIRLGMTTDGAWWRRPSCCHAATYRRRIGPLSGAHRALTGWRSGFFSIDRPPSGLASTTIRVAGLEARLEHPLGQRILDLVLDLAAQRAGAEGLVVALGDEASLAASVTSSSICWSASCALHPRQQQVDDLADLARG